MILTPAEFLALVNATPLGEVVSDRQLRRLRRAAGLDGPTIEVGKLLAHLVEQFESRQAQREDAPATDAERYAEHREQTGAAERERSAAGREIGAIPAVADPARRESCRNNFRLFCETYFASVFKLQWSSDHLRVIERIESSILSGGLFAIAMPRGSGKTSLTETAAMWAVVYGHRRFVAIVGADREAAGELLESIQIEIEENDLLAEDFPAVCIPIRALEGIANRCKGQTCQGERTRIEITRDKLILPTIPNAESSGAILCCRGITGRIRGMKHKRAGDLESARPDLVILDDPQTDESATSPGLTAKRMRVVNGAVLGLAGPTKRIAGVMPCTVIAPNDLADQVLDRKKCPAWQGERCALIYAWPDRLDLWERYAEILADPSYATYEAAHQAATKFYKQNRKAMDAGAHVAWPERFDDNQISALQYAFDLKIFDILSFEAEYQNAPIAAATSERVERLTVDQLAAKVGPFARGQLPLEASTITGFIDVQMHALYWVLAAWSRTFDGWILDYGCYPEQPTRHFVYSAIRKTLAQEFPGASVDGRIRRGLDELSERLMAREFSRPDGGTLKLDRLFVDANWKTQVIYRFVRETRGPITPTHGRGIRASDAGLLARKLQPGEKSGLEWLQPLVRRKRAVPHVLYDTNFWKTFIHERLVVPTEEKGSLVLFAGKPVEHRMIAEHLDAETAERVHNERTGRTVDEWTLLPGRDNHLLDGVVGCAVGASYEGVELAELLENKPRKSSGRRPRRSLADLQQRRRER